MSTKDGVIVAVVGSRSMADYAKVTRCLDKIPCIVGIVSGGARGADSLGARYANEHSLQLKEHIPDWNKYGKSAGFRRNHRIISDADYVVAFWDGMSKGTAHSIQLTIDSDTPGIIYKP